MREIMWNISHGWLMYVAFIASLIIFTYGVRKRIVSWRAAKKDPERFTDWFKRFGFLIREIVLQKRVMKSTTPGIFHSFIFYSFIFLVFVTSIIALDYDFGTNLFKGDFYSFLSIGADIGGFLILIGLGIASWRRYIQKPLSISTTFTDSWAILLLFIIVLSGFVVEGLRIASVPDSSPLLSPVGIFFSLAFGVFSTETTRILHIVLWWFHMGISMLWIALIPYSKFFHLIALPTNNFFQKLQPVGQLKHPDIEKLMTENENFSIGINNQQDLTWKHKLDQEACIKCGRCDEACPASRAKHKLSPQKLIAALGSTDTESVWNCRTCGSCVEICPATIDHVDHFIDLRRNSVVMQGQMPDDISRVLRMMEEQGNPFGPQNVRTEWIQKNGWKVLAPGQSTDVLYWIGCLTSFSSSRRAIAESVCMTLQKLKTDFAVLGEAERCCGDPARSVGQEYLFQQIAKTQIAELNARKFNTILVSCPHCMNVIKNEYRALGASFNVIHYSEYFASLGHSPVAIDSMAFHDPCYLGRYQGVYDEPRNLISESAIDFKENKANSFCCGGGGGHFWMEAKQGENIGTIRIKQALEKNAKGIITACPFCTEMLEHAATAMNLEDKFKISELATLIQPKT